MRCDRGGSGPRAGGSGGRSGIGNSSAISREKGSVAQGSPAFMSVYDFLYNNYEAILRALSAR